MCNLRKNASIGGSFNAANSLLRAGLPLRHCRIILTLFACFGSLVQRNHARITNQEIGKSKYSIILFLYDYKNSMKFLVLLSTLFFSIFLPVWKFTEEPAPSL